MSETVGKLHRAIVSALRQTRGDDFSEPVTVSEIYQQLVPYRTARSEIGFQMNADYEYALMRLLAGEDDLARLEPAEVREMLRGELESPNPNVSLYRDYANCDVWIAAPLPWLSEEPQLHARPATPPAEEDFETEPSEDYPAERVAAERAPAPVRPNPVADPRECAFCGGSLPRGRLVNFCPNCGNDLSRRPCPSCGEVLESRWRFCANCGTPVENYDTEAN